MQERQNDKVLHIVYHVLEETLHIVMNTGEIWAKSFYNVTTRRLITMLSGMLKYIVGSDRKHRQPEKNIEVAETISTFVVMIYTK